MIYLKATLLGLMAGLLLAIAAATIEGLLAMETLGSGSGGIGSVSVGLGTAAPAFIIGFIAAFYWTIRRSRRRVLRG